MRAVIGDNPNTDIKGANAARDSGGPWESILVRSGLARANHAKYPASQVSEDLLGAVEEILGAKIERDDSLYSDDDDR